MTQTIQMLLRATGTDLEDMLETPVVKCKDITSHGMCRINASL